MVVVVSEHQGGKHLYFQSQLNIGSAARTVHSDETEGMKSRVVPDEYPPILNMAIWPTLPEKMECEVIGSNPPPLDPDTDTDPSPKHSSVTHLAPV